MKKSDIKKNNLNQEKDRKEISFDPDNLFVDNQFDFIDRGYEFLELGKYKEAIELFSLSLADDDTNIDLLNGLGIAFCEIGRYRESFLILNRAARLHPDDPITYANLAGTYWELNQYEKAQFYYKKSIDCEPEIEETYINLTYLYLEMDMMYPALITCFDLLKEFPDSDEGKELFEEIISDLALLS